MRRTLSRAARKSADVLYVLLARVYMVSRVANGQFEVDLFVQEVHAYASIIYI